MSGSRKRLLHVANTLGLACVAATCFLVACGDTDDSSGDTPKGGAGGSSGKAGSGGGGKAGAPPSDGGSSASAGEAGDGNVAGEGGEGGEAGSETGGTGGSTAGTGGSTGGTGGSIGGTGGTGGSGGSGGAPVVLVQNCLRDLTSGRKIEISTAGNDGLFAAAYGPDGLLYAAGYTQPGVGALEDRSTVVVRFTAAGALDPSWGVNGVVTVNVKATDPGLAGLGELPRGLAFQGTSIIVAGTVETYTSVQNPTLLNSDRDVYVLRLTAAGALDTTFGDNASGIHILPLNTGVANAAGTGITGADAQWGLNVLPDNTLIVTAATRASGLQPAPSTDPRTDTDFAVVKLTANGAQDTTFGLVGGTPGVFTFDIAQANASVRTASVLPDGKLIVTGYSTYNGSQRPVIFKLNANGQSLDTSFGFQGVFSDTVGVAAEAYGALLQTGGKLVTVGYGRATANNTTSDILSIRLTSNGLLDSTYGATTGTGATPGRAWFDVGGLGDNGRAIVLSDDRPVLLGGGSLSTGQQDAVITLLSLNGTPVTTFGSPYGCTAYDFGSVGDFFWSGAVNPTDGKIAAVGLTGHASGSTDDTDGILVLINKP
ncbi:MAG: hypothetical protein WDO74_26990 [Pseudomonadota bacterium]